MSCSWIPLNQTQEFGSVFWRMLLDSKLDGILAGTPEPTRYDVGNYGVQNLTREQSRPS